ncbi:4606_t:CDS:2 [Funneliformis caledonium]|uniref:4606_t:CDS:1 n=1 Tax=Funneliformis caledonium TaxID=1117310 RepID=A0A9N9DQ87_9GLOM|nr:4606_t:CDS:2 [Funneliformis caledonium]
MADITLFSYLLEVDVLETNNNEANKLSPWKFETPFKKDNKLKILNEKFRNDIDIEQELGTTDDSPSIPMKRPGELQFSNREPVAPFQRDFWNDPKAKTVLKFRWCYKTNFISTPLSEYMKVEKNEIIL